jgi:geranylgeranylglycerol-phosphate geranylgeranyltransferase
MLGYVQLLRPANCLMTSVAIFIGGLLVMGGLGPEALGAIFLAMVAGFVITGAGNTINDWTDVESDKVNRPNRPIPSGRVSKRAGLMYAVLLFLIGIVMAGFINWAAFIIAAFNSFLLVVYSTHLKERLLVGNAAVSYLVGSGFLFGGAALGNMVLPLILTVLAGLANMSREIVKDLEDVEGDRVGFMKKLTNGVQKRVRTITQRFGISKSGVQLRHGSTLKAVAAISLALAIAVSPMPFLMGILGFSYMVVLAAADLVFLGSIYLIAKANTKKGYTRASRAIKYGMFLGLVAFIAGVLI